MYKNEVLDHYDQSPVNIRFVLLFALFCTAFAFDFFDFFIVGFLMSVIGPGWHLTYLESSIMLLTGGIGAICGAIAFGMFADNFGRKSTVITAMMICAVGSVALGFGPEGNWIFFAVLRFVIGFGLGGVAGVLVILAVELTPTKHRAFLSGLPVICPSVGTLLASAAAAHLLPLMGWRGLAMLGVAPAAVALGVAIWSPESFRWLLTKGRVEEARKGVAYMLDQPVSRVPMGSRLVESRPTGSFFEVFANQRRFWVTIVIWAGCSTANYGVYLWGPTIVAMLMGVSPANAATYFIYTSLVGMLGRLIFCALPLFISRRHSGTIGGLGAAIVLAMAAMGVGSHIGNMPAFVVFLIGGAIFFDGVFCVLSPYTAEVYPVRLAARGIGVAQSANGIGKIAGPLCLAVIAGGSNILAPKATVDAVFPAFMFLAACCLAAGLAFAFFAPHVTKESLNLDDAEEAAEKKARSAAA